MVLVTSDERSPDSIFFRVRENDLKEGGLKKLWKFNGALRIETQSVEGCSYRKIQIKKMVHSPLEDLLFRREHFHEQ